MTTVTLRTCDWCGKAKTEVYDETTYYENRWDCIIFPNPPGGRADFCSQECKDKWWERAFSKEKE